MRTLLLSLLCCIPVIRVFAATEEPAPWETALRFDYNEASESFARLRKASPSDARIAIAHASVLLVRQPRTTGNILVAHSLLKAVASRSIPFDGAPEDDVLLALFLAARVEQDHLEPPRPADARAAYQVLMQDHPGHPLAGQAAVQLSLLDAWDEPRLPAENAIGRITARLPLVATRPEAARDLRMILARLEWEDRRDARAAIVHLQAGRAIGYQSPFRNAEVDLMIANLAARLNDNITASAHYRAFLDGKRQDIRTSAVRRRLAGMETGATRREESRIP
ncbi:MAG: hypothetical protein LBK99_09075 [Opitutaceae bacterium]|jgi:hypothetical protein|nr:hypothetical protein [Opitutaceae bacterium]